MLHGMWIIVTHGNGHAHGYEIDRVQRREGGSAIILTMDHGLRIEGERTQEVFYPQRTIEGSNGFRIPLVLAVTDAASDAGR